MKILKTAVTVICIFTVATLFLASFSYAEIPRIINYQGKLTDTDGKPVSDGAYSVTFRIYDQGAGGSPLWYETQSLTTQKGIFSTQIGATKDLNLSFDKPYYLGIQVGSDAEMTPRQPFSSSAYAFESAHAAEATEAAHAAVADTVTDATKLLPTGVILPWAGTEVSVPEGWLLCDGKEVSRSTYVDLFSIIGVIYGSGNGSTTFNLPDLRGRSPLGKDNMGGTSADRVTASEADELGQGAGEEHHTLTITEMPSHTHILSNNWWRWNLGGPAFDRDYWAVCGGADSNHPGVKYTSPNGGDQPHNNMPPYITLNWIIKA